MALGFAGKHRCIVVAAVTLLIAASVYGVAGAMAAAVIVSAFGTSFMFPAAAVAALPSLLIWTPKFGWFGAASDPGFLRIDHAVVAGLALHLVAGWRHRLRDMGLYAPLALYVALVLVSATVGMLCGTAASPGYALAAVAQTGHLILVFVAAFSLGHCLGSGAVYALAVPALAAAGYGIAESLWPLEFLYDAPYRTFERGLFPGQANHMAGFLAMAAVTGVALVRETRWRIVGLGMCVACGAALLTTHSREGAIALAAGLTALAVLRRPRLAWFLAAALAAVLAVAPWERLLDVRGSLFDRVVHWSGAVSTLPEHPWWGLGPGARHRSFYDNHYLMTAAEQGLLALAAFMAWLACLARSLAHRSRHSGVTGAMALGATACLAALAVQSLAAIGWGITMLAGPFYWLAGVALARGERE